MASSNNSASEAQKEHPAISLSAARRFPKEQSDTTEGLSSKAAPQVDDGGADAIQREDVALASTAADVEQQDSMNGQQSAGHARHEPLQGLQLHILAAGLVFAVFLVMLNAQIVATVC